MDQWKEEIKQALWEAYERAFQSVEKGALASRQRCELPESYGNIWVAVVSDVPDEEEYV